MIIFLRICYVVVVLALAACQWTAAYEAKQQRREIQHVRSRFLIFENLHLNRKMRDDGSELAELRDRVKQLEHAAGLGPQEQ